MNTTTQSLVDSLRYMCDGPRRLFASVLLHCKFTQICNNRWRKKLWGDKLLLIKRVYVYSLFFLMKLLFQSQCVNERLLDLNDPRLLHSLVFLSEISLRLKAPPMSMLARSHHYDRKKLGTYARFPLTQSPKASIRRTASLK